MNEWSVPNGVLNFYDKLTTLTSSVTVF